MKQTRRESLGRMLVVSAVLATPFAAHAGEGAYIGIGLGGNFPVDQEFNAAFDGGTVLAPINRGDTITQSDFDAGPLVALTFGYKLYNGLRPELELSYTQNDFDHNRYAERDGTFESGGKEKVGMVFGNLWYDIYPRSDVHPYIGGGVGGAYIDIRHPDFRNTQLGSDDDKVLAYQAGFGVIFDATSQTDISIDYRYVSSKKGKYDLDGNGDTTVKMRYESQVAMVSFHYYFGAPTPPPAPPPEPTPEPAAVVEPPPPPPPPCESDPTKTINLAGCNIGDTVVLRGVNFDFDKATLTTNAKTLLDQVADALLARMDIKVQIAGHTDAFGSDAYNQKLSEERAASVVQYLVGRGIDAGRMTSIGYGESKPVADNATDEGREQNRRVELNVTETATGSAPVVSEPASPSAEATPSEPPAAAPEAAPPAEAAPAESSAPVDAPLPEATPVP